jgi:NADPH:quinone reductase
MSTAFWGGPAPITIPAMLVVAKNLIIRRFANLESDTVRDPQRLAAALKELEGFIEDPLFRTTIGKTFSFDQIEAAMAYEMVPGKRAVLVPR